MGIDDFDWELSEIIEDLAEEELLERGSKEYGVAQQVIYDGYDSLTNKQKYIYDKHVIPLLKGQHRQCEINRILSSVID